MVLWLAEMQGEWSEGAGVEICGRVDRSDAASRAARASHIV
jgi:hypothetical protein